MIVCPRCFYENEDSAMNCARCRINLQWALENPHEAGLREPERVGEPPPEAQAENRVVRVFLFIVLLLAIPVSGLLAFSSSWNAVTSVGSHRSGYVAAWFWVVVGVVCILAAIAVLLPRRVRPTFYRGLRIMGLIALTGGSLYGLMRLTLVILPEHTGQSLVVQYKLGERDFRGATLEQADLSGAKLSMANLIGANLSGANLGRANLIGANLQGANLRGTDLSGAYLCKTNLHGADLREADLTGANLFKANLREADLREAVLYGTDPFSATPLEADLRGAILSRANLSGAAVTDEQLAGAESLEGTILPNGSVHE